MNSIQKILKTKTLKNGVDDRFAKIAQLGDTIFHSGDLANLWGITDANTLHTTLKRYAERGLLVRIHKGLYTIRPLRELDPRHVGIAALHRYAYVGTETVLAQAGIIQQIIPCITLVSSVSKRFTIGEECYRARTLADRFLFSPAGIAVEDGVHVASTERAIADMLYFNPCMYFDGERAGVIDWDTVRALAQEIGYPNNHTRGRVP